MQKVAELIKVLYLQQIYRIPLRYFLQFSYNGAAYHGWQYQPNAISVQEVLEAAFTVLMPCKVSLTAAGRTDAGVHARQMFAHFEVLNVFDIKNMIYRLNALLPDDIAVQQIIPVGHDAHARFSATARTYEYWVTQEKNPFYINYAHYIRHKLDFEKMNDAAALLLNYKDFKCFSKSNTDVSTYLCDIKMAKWSRQKDVFVFTIKADRFLRNMVRAIVGTLLDVGVGKSSLEDVKAIINSKDRSKAGTSVPAKALYLNEISYPNTIL